MKKKSKKQFQRRAPGVDASLTRHGGLSYIEIPTVKPRQSAAFYKNGVGWKVAEANTDHPKFSDPTGHLIGRWITGRAISRKPGLLPYFYVDDIKEAVKRVAPNGGEIVKAPYPEGDLWVSIIRDPTGNMIGLWQEMDRSPRPHQ